MTTDNNLNAAAPGYVTQSITLSGTGTPANPTITFAVANHAYGDAPFTVSATSNATGAFTYSVVSGPATISGSTVTLTGAGTVVLQTSEAADTNYTAATMNVTFTVAAIAPTITFAVANHTYGDAPFAVSATSNATGAFTYSVVSGPATISGSTVTLTGAGTVVLNAADNPKLSGQQRIYVFENGHIVMPYGSVGLKWEYRWKDGVFQTEELYDPLRRLYAL